MNAVVCALAIWVSAVVVVGLSVMANGRGDD